MSRISPCKSNSRCYSLSDPAVVSIASVKSQKRLLHKMVREKSKECRNHKPQPFPDSKRKRKPTNPNKHKSNKRTKSTKISSLFPKRGNCITAPEPYKAFEVLKVNYCDRSMSVVPRPSRVVRLQRFALKAYSSYNPGPIDSKHDRKHWGDINNHK